MASVSSVVRSSTWGPLTLGVRFLSVLPASMQVALKSRLWQGHYMGLHRDCLRLSHFWTSHLDICPLSTLWLCPDLVSSH